MSIKVYEIKMMDSGNGLRQHSQIECQQCGRLHYKLSYEVDRGLTRNGKFFCSLKCYGSYHSRTQTVYCSNCNIAFMKKHSQIKKSKSGNNFCSSSCAATFNNKHKKYGTRRSKLEIYLEEQLVSTFPELEIMCNSKEAIGSELDFFLPQLKLAIQINGILHYQPIYGEEKLARIRRGDRQKRKVCKQNNIILFEINCSTDNYLNKKLKEKRWLQVKTKVEELILQNTGFSLSSTTIH